MAYADSARRFSRQGARHMTAVHGGTLDNGTADERGWNILSGARKYRVPFVVFANRREIELAGFELDCHAAMAIPDELGLTFALGDEITYLPDSRKYHVAEIGPLRSTRLERRYALRRLEE